MARPRRNKRVRFRSHRGAGHSAAFRAHKGGIRRRAFGAHLARALKVAKVKAARPKKPPKAAAYKGIGARNPYPAKAKAAAFKSALPSAPKARAAKKRRVATYKAVKPKGL